MSELYRVVLEGGSETVAPAEVVGRIAGLFHLGEDKVEELLGRAPVAVKSDLGKGMAEKLALALAQCGARAKVEPMPEPEDVLIGGAMGATGDRQMVCPACGQYQPEAPSCVFCGKVVAKVQEALRRRQEEAQAAERRRKPRNMPELNLRPMSVGEMLSEAFTMLRERVLVFAGIVCAVPAAMSLAVVGALGLAAYAAYYAGGGVSRGDLAALFVVGPSAFPASLFLPIVLTLVAVCAVVFIFLWSQAALTYAISERHLGHEISVLPSYRFTLKRMPSVYWTGLTTIFMIWGALIALIVPAVFLGPMGVLMLVPALAAAAYLGMRYALVEKIVVIEGLTGSEARERSAALVEGRCGRLVAIGFVFGVVELLARMTAGIFAPLLEAMPEPFQTLGAVALGVPLFTFGLAFPAMGLCLFYYDARLRTDGSLSYEDLARNLG